MCKRCIDQLPLTCPQLGAWLAQPRHVSWLGIEPATLWFANLSSIHWATPARPLFFVFCFLFSVQRYFLQFFSLCFTIPHFFPFPFLNCSPVFRMVNSYSSRTQPHTTSGKCLPRSYSVGWVLLWSTKAQCTCFTEGLSHCSDYPLMCVSPTSLWIL